MTRSRASKIPKRPSHSQLRPQKGRCGQNTANVTASRELLEGLHALGIKLLALHDFDKAGFSIFGTMQKDTRRYSFAKPIKVIDLGLRLDDIEDLEIDDDLIEAANYKGTRAAARLNLLENGATLEEIEFLLDSRIELNALTSDELVEFTERKLKQYGVKKLVPDNTVLADAYRRTARQEEIQKLIEAEAAKLRDKPSGPVPADLRKRVEDMLSADPTLSWDAALIEIVRKTRND